MPIKDLPVDIINYIFSYIETEKCYRCGVKLSPSNDYFKCYDQKFCSWECIDYQHY